MPDQANFTMTCHLCGYHCTVSVSETIRPDLTQEEATRGIVERSVRAEYDFFREHWDSRHPVEAEEIVRHIAMVSKLVRVTTYHRRVLEGCIEGPAEGAGKEANQQAARMRLASKEVTFHRL